MKIHLNVILGDNKHEMIQNVLVFLACDRGDGIVKKEEDLNEFIAMLLWLITSNKDKKYCG